MARSRVSADCRPRCRRGPTRERSRSARPLCPNAHRCGTPMMATSHRVAARVARPYGAAAIIAGERIGFIKHGLSLGRRRRDPALSCVRRRRRRGRCPDAPGARGRILRRCFGAGVSRDSDARVCAGRRGVGSQGLQFLTLRTTAAQSHSQQAQRQQRYQHRRGTRHEYAGGIHRYQGAEQREVVELGWTDNDSHAENRYESQQDQRKYDHDSMLVPAQRRSLAPSRRVWSDAADSLTKMTKQRSTCG